MTIAKTPQLEQAFTLPYRLVLDFRAVNVTREQFFQFCLDNGDYRVELTAKKELILMPPARGTTGGANSELTADLVIWSRQEGNGKTFDSSTGFILPNGAVRSPDVSWIPLSRWETLSESDRNRFPPICPDFVIELRSPSDRLPDLQAKMAEYVGNGARLGWLVDAQTQQVHVYRPGQDVQVLNAPDSISGEPVLQGFVLDLTRIW